MIAQQRIRRRLGLLYLAITLGVSPGAYLRADCTLTNLGLIPLCDLGWGVYTNNFAGGLYPDGANSRPPAHASAGLQIALEQIKPLDTNGLPDASNGRIVVLSSGMSNTTQDWASKGTNHFKSQAERDPSKNPQVLIVDGARGGQDAPAWTNLVSENWSNVVRRLETAKATTNQVQVLWIKQAIKGESGPLTSHAVQLQGYLEQIVRNAKSCLPNLKIVYLSSRTRAYVYGAGLNPEPFAYETAFAVKWLIEKQINGAPELNFDPAKGPVVAPWLSWGPYLWTDGLSGRSDGFQSICPTDLENDFTHPSSNGVAKVASELLAFFKTDPTATPWFLRNTVNGLPPLCAPTADLTNGTIPLTVQFIANANDPDGPIRDYQWTFEDGTFSTNANPLKVFPAPGTYHARLTVTDTNGNTAQGQVVVQALGIFELWRQAKFTAVELAQPGISGPGADPDLDGLSNQWEYALGLNPKVDDRTNGMPRAGLESGAFTYSFTRFKAAQDVTISIEETSDLIQWNPCPDPVQRLDNGPTESVTLRTPLRGAVGRFFRLKLQWQ